MVKKSLAQKEMEVKGEEIKATQCAAFTCRPDKTFDRLPIGRGAFLEVRKDDKTKPFSVGALRYALIPIKFIDEQSFHGFRASGWTIVAEVLGINDRHLEAQLSHKIKGDPLKEAYNRTKFVEQRREVIQLWANYLDGLKAGADVVPLKAKVI